MAGGDKGGDEKAAATEPLFAQVPTAELKKILSDRFAQQVSSATRAKLLRAFTFLGLPGILAAGGVLWKVLDNEVSRKVSDSREALASKVATDLDRGLGSLRRDLEAYTKEQVATAFTGRYGEALHSQLRAAMASQSFQREMRSTISNEVTEVWTRDKDRLRKGFLEVLTADKRFLDEFSREVAGAMGKSDAVPAIIAEALAGSVRDAKPGEAGRATAALSLLAAVDQGRANAAVRDLFEGAARALPEDEGGRQGRREMALQGLQHVGFGGSGAALSEGATGMLAAALTAWVAHCAAVPCGGAEHAPARALEAFLARGRDLPEAESDAWVMALALWHEELLRGDGRARRSSLHLVPRALGAIGTDEALRTLVRWFTSGDPNLALSAAEALGSRGAWHLDDAKRLALFKDLWPRGTTAEARRALLTEAEWMALGRVSDGRADPAGAYRPEASLVRARPSLTAGRPPISRWAARPAASERQRGPAPPAEPCALGIGAASQRRAELCALAALIRPDRGAAEWSELRGVTLWDEDEVAVLGLLWTVAASRAAEGAPGVEGRLAPLPDLLRPRSPPPAGWRLAAMLLLRTAPEQAAWQALRQLRPSLADAPLFAAASRWLFRPWAVSQAWFVEELRQLPPDLRAAVAREVVALALPPDEADADDPVPAVVRRLPSGGVAALNALGFAHASDPDATLAAVERENGFRPLADAAAGGASGGGVQAGVARELFDALLDRAEWPQAVIAASQGAGAAAAPLRPGPRTPLVPSVQGRFGRLRLAGGDTLALAPAEAGKGSGALPPVAFYNPATRETRVLGPGDTWVLPGYAEEEWMFRLRAGGAPGAVQLAATPSEALAPAAAASAADLPVVEEGRVYTVGHFPNGPGGAAGEAGEVAGWARTPGLRAGERVRISTFDLADDVDTLVELRRAGEAAPLHRDDDGGDGLASRLEWTVDRDGEVLIRLVHIGVRGAFRLRLERLGRAPRAETAAVGG